jgi:uncharacterized protein
MNPIDYWPQIRRLCNRAFGSSLHFSLASITEDGAPHVTPIGSLLLREPGQAIYFERFTRHMPHNFEHNNKVCVLAVNSGLWFWITSLLRGRFSAPPALRLHGTVGVLRPATSSEVAAWRRRVRRLRWTKGYALIWAGMSEVRDIHFTTVEEVHIGPMTQGVWAEFAKTEQAPS